MAFDQGLAERIRGVLSDRHDVVEKRMFGGVVFMVHGHMAVGIIKDSLMVRVSPDAHADLVRKPHARVMDMTGRPMKGLLLVGPTGVDADADLERWIGHGVEHALSLPAKRRKFLASLVLLALTLPSLAADTPRHLLYLHGRIVQEQQSARPQQPRFGFYELEQILTTFRDKGFVVTGGIRPKAASVSQSADVVVGQVRALLRKGVAPDHVTVVGASMGGGTALVASARLQEPGVRFAVMGVCLSQNVQALIKDEGKAPSGHVLAIRETTDELTADCPAWTPEAKATGLVVREMVLDTGLSHGFLYRPIPEWVKPVVEWVQSR